MVDFIIDPSIDNGVRHQYHEYWQKSVLTYVDVAGISGAGKVTAGLCRATALPFQEQNSRPQRNPDFHAFPASTSSTTYDLGVIGKQNGSKYRMTGRWYRNYGDSPPTGSVTDCNPS